MPEPEMQGDGPSAIEVVISTRQGIEANLATLPGKNLKRLPPQFRAPEAGAVTWLRVDGKMLPYNNYKRKL